MEIAWKILWFFSLPRICTDPGVTVRFIKSSETITNMLPTAHPDYRDFTEVLTSLLIWLNFQSFRGRTPQKQYPISLQDATTSFKFMSCLSETLTILNCETENSKKSLKCQKDSPLTESFAGGSQIKSPEEAVTTLLVSLSSCSVDQSDPVTTETMRGRNKQRIWYLVKRCMIFPFLLPTHLFFIPLPHKACSAKHL